MGKIKIPKSIDQSGIAALVVKRMNNPALYAERPLVIWRSDFHDGIQFSLLHETLREYNRGKEKDAMKYYVPIRLGDGEQSIYDDSAQNNPHLGFYVIDPARERLTETSLREKLSRLLSTRQTEEIRLHPDIPMVTFLCREFDFDGGWLAEVCPEAEQYIFEPDFEQWAARGRHVYLTDFIRGNGDKAGITYRWYNYFYVDPTVGCQGCAFPDYWLVGLCRLQLRRKVMRVERLGDLSDEDFRSAFHEGISADLVKNFKAYLKIHSI